MTDLNSLAAFGLAAIATFVATPVTIALANRTGFLDHPAGYKGHLKPTPYLGGTAVFAGFVLAALTLSGAAEDFAAIMACATGLWVIGTLDDRVAVPPVWRILAEVGAAGVLTASDMGWSLFSSDLLNFALTAIWIVGLVNAFNLMDNLDGAGATVAAVSSAGIGVLALIHDEPALGAFSFAICGACAGFLPRNLARPARSFLGDGGSMTVGFLVASTAIAATDRDALGAAALLEAAMFVGLPILDTALVVFSRTRRGIPIVTAGRDHLTHRLLPRAGSPRAVAAMLGCAQAAVCALAIVGDHTSRTSVVGLAVGSVVAGLAAIAVLESRTWPTARLDPQHRGGP